MKNKTVLIISTYPIKNPQHGGQKRTHAIYDAYCQKFDTVVNCAVFFRGFYSDYDKQDIPLSRESEILVQQSPWTGDIVCGEAIYKDTSVKSKMTKLLLSLKPDIIHIEQPFPYLGLRPLLKELRINSKIVFGSQNIEAPMKREILEGMSVEESTIAPIEKQIKQLEIDLSRDSDLVIGCTDGDISEHMKMGAKKAVLAKNGISRTQNSPEDKRYWEDEFGSNGFRKSVLFVASAHPPSWTGFFDIVTKGLGFVPKDSRIVVAGSICDYFTQNISEETLDIKDTTFWLRAYPAGRLSENRLSALIEKSEVIILPITEGGGSNLKTAEAILANKKVVATTHALRSFEWFKNFPNTWIADSPKDFHLGIIEALNAPLEKRTVKQQEQAERVQWKYALIEAVSEVGRL